MQEYNVNKALKLFEGNSCLLNTQVDRLITFSLIRLIRYVKVKTVIEKRKKSEDILNFL